MLVRAAALAAVVILAGGPALADGIVDTVDPIVDTVNDTTDPIVDTVNDTVDTVNDTVNDTTDPVVDTVNDTVNDTTDPVVDTVNDTVDTVNDTTAPVVDVVNDTTDPITGALSGSTDAGIAGVTADSNTGGAVAGSTSDSTDGRDVAAYAEASSTRAWSASTDALRSALQRREGGVPSDLTGDDAEIVAGGAGHLGSPLDPTAFCASTPNVCIGLTDVSGWLLSLFGILGEGLMGLPITGTSLLNLAALGLASWLIGVVVMRRSGRPARAIHPANPTGP